MINIYSDVVRENIRCGLTVYAYLASELINSTFGIAKQKLYTMPTLPAYKIQEICCDATSVHLPDNLSFFFKSSYHNVCTMGRVHVDFSLHVIAKPVQPFGIWRCRVNFWLQDVVKELNDEQGLEYFKEGFRAALAEAEKFVQWKYKVTSIMAAPTDAELAERYKVILAKKK